MISAARQALALSATAEQGSCKCHRAPTAAFIVIACAIMSSVVDDQHHLCHSVGAVHANQQVVHGVAAGQCRVQVVPYISRLPCLCGAVGSALEYFSAKTTLGSKLG
jgi:hypothetical protein